MKLKKIITYVAIVVVIAGAIVAMDKFKPKESVTTAADVKESKTAVEAIVAKSTKKNLDTSYKATLDSSSNAMVSSKLSAKVLKVLFEDGDTVKEGADLIVLDQEDLNNQLKVAQNQLKASQNQLEGAKMQAASYGNQLISVQNQLKNAQNQLLVAQSQLAGTDATNEKVRLNLNNCQNNYNRIKTLFDAGATTQADLDGATLALKSAQVDEESTKSNIEVLKLNIENAKTNIEECKNSIEKTNSAIAIAHNSVEAVNISIDSIGINISNLKDTLANAVIKAPMSGVIDQKNVVVGQFASPGSPLAFVKNISTIDAVIKVEQQDIENINLGDTASIIVSGDNGDKTYTGIVKTIDSFADPSARVFTAKISIDNQANQLRPGMYAKVSVKNNATTQVMELPISALVGNDGAYFIFTAENGVAQKKEVKIGTISEKTVDILTGIEDGAEVIVTNLASLSDGTKVSITRQGE